LAVQQVCLVENGRQLVFEIHFVFIEQIEVMSVRSDLGNNAIAQVFTGKRSHSFDMIANFEFGHDGSSIMTQAWAF
jgi:hypothetical protein